MPEILSNQPNTLEAWTTGRDLTVARTNQALGHFMYDLLIRSLTVKESTLPTQRFYEVTPSSLDMPLAKILEELVLSGYPISSRLITHWVDIAGKETAIAAQDPVSKMVPVADHLPDGLSPDLEEIMVEAAKLTSSRVRDVAENGINAPLVAHREVLDLATVFSHPLTARRLLIT